VSDGSPEPIGTPDRSRLEAVARGRVQGVGFRYFVIREALDLDVEGWVANEPDGSVRCVAEGPRDRLEALLAILEEGPPSGRVEQVAVSWQHARGGLGRFTVRSGAHRGD
jgi:acylphosphatase